MELKASHIVMDYNKAKWFTKKKQVSLALNDVSFCLKEGIYGLMGANGAGKSTLMNILVGNLKPTQGQIFLDGREQSASGNDFRANIGYMPQQQWVYEMMSCRHFLEYVGVLKGLSPKELKKQVPEMLAFVNLQEHSEKHAGALSGGMRQRLLLAQAILGNPKILILDEPTAGVDPNERIRIRNLISQISLHKIVLIATHVVSDIEYISDSFLLLKEGVLFQNGTLDELLKEIDGKVLECLVTEKEIPLIEKKYNLVSLLREGELVRARIVTDSYLDDYVVRRVKPSLEDLYLYYYGGEEELSLS